MKVLLLGHRGLLGSSLLSQIDSLDTTELRFGDLEFTNFIRSSNYDAIINCIVNKVDDRRVNIELPVFLAESCRYLIQFSSDAVFSGNKPNHLVYHKNDIPDPVCVYGQQKYDMEKELSRYQNCLIIRTSFIHAEDQFVSNILTQDRFTGFSNYLWSGLTANQVAALTANCLHNRLMGLSHMFSKKSISKYELASRVALFYNSSTEIIPVEYPIVNRQITTDFDIDLNINSLVE